MHETSFRDSQGNSNPASHSSCMQPPWYSTACSAVQRIHPSSALPCQTDHDHQQQLSHSFSHTIATTQFHFPPTYCPLIQRLCSPIGYLQLLQHAVLWPSDDRTNQHNNNDYNIHIIYEKYKKIRKRTYIIYTYHRHHHHGRYQPNKHLCDPSIATGVAYPSYP